MLNQTNINVIADTHTHSLACDHAYSTINENAAAAAQKGLRYLALTEHGPAMPGAPTFMHFANLRSLPRTLHGVMLIKGCEVNINDTKGSLDLPESSLSGLEWVIASMHIPTFQPEDKKAHTAAWLAVAENPHVDVIGHCGDMRYTFDEATVLKSFKKHGKIVEINAHSFNVRPGSGESCPRIARLCAELGIPVVVSSDAHFHTNVGNVAASLDMLAAIDFPEELILNISEERFAAVLAEKGVS